MGRVFSSLQALGGDIVSIFCTRPFLDLLCPGMWPIPFCFLISLTFLSFALSEEDGISPLALLPIT
jgi:hypothetical protein